MELVLRSGNVMDCHATARGSIPGRNGVFIELHVLRKGQFMGVPSLNDLAVDGTLNTTNQPTKIYMYVSPYFQINDLCMLLALQLCHYNSMTMSRSFIDQ